MKRLFATDKKPQPIKRHRYGSQSQWPHLQNIPISKGDITEAEEGGGKIVEWEDQIFCEEPFLRCAFSPVGGSTVSVIHNSKPGIHQSTSRSVFMFIWLFQFLSFSFVWHLVSDWIREWKIHLPLPSPCWHLRWLLWLDKVYFVLMMSHKVTKLI